MSANNNNSKTSNQKTLLDTLNLTTQDYIKMLDGCVDSIIIINKKGVIHYFNPAGEEMFGYSKSEVLGQNVSILMNREDAIKHDTYIDKYIQTEKAKVIGIGREVIAKHKDGKEFSVLLTLSEVKLENQHLFTAFIKDISEHKRLETQVKQQLEEVQASEEELRQNMEELQSTQELMQQKEVELTGQINAIDSTLATIEFDLSGNILKANDSLLRTMGYSIEEIKGKHHQIFVNENYAKSFEYRTFWNNLSSGIPQTGEFNRFTKQGQEIWLRATYTPVRDSQDKPFKVIKLALDITEEKKRSLDFEGQLEAIDKSNAKVEFDMTGRVLQANSIFLNLVGYNSNEVLGKHHSIFLNEIDKESSDYKRFWEDLNASKFQAGEFKRLTKKGEEVWIRASYNPILDLNGKPYKVVKFAQNITKQKLLEETTSQQLEEVRAAEEELRQNMEELQATQEKQAQLSKELSLSEAEVKGQMTAINTSYALIEFLPDGHILNANSIFLNTVGYSLEEIKGKHHQIFVDKTYVQSPDYRQFWIDLSNGLTKTDTYQRFNKQGQEVWLDAAYAPVFDENNKVTKIIKIAQDVTDFTIALKATRNFLEEIKKGNFEADINLQGKRVSGDLANMITDNLKLRDTLKVIIQEINRVVNLAGVEGILSERLQIEEQEGAWKDLIHSLNTLLKSIGEPVLEINRIITNLSMGDITQSFEKDASGDILDMANALNIALKNLNELLVKIEESSLTIASASQQMQNKSIGLQNSTQEASVAIQEMADGAQEQANRTDESSRLVEETLKAAIEVSDKAEVINNTAEKGQESCQSGLGIMTSLVENMDGIAHSADITTEAISVLSNRSEEISRILNVITDIAFQTKLLSVNAKIEANRAGEYGRGFQVVADEIGKLAEESKQSTIEIDKVIKDVQKDIQSTSNAIDNMKSSVKDGNEATQKASSVFNEINSSSTQTLELSKEIRQSSQNQKDAINAVVHNIEKIVVVSEQTASGTQEVANSARETDKAMQEITQTSQSLSTIAKELKDRVNKFKLKR